MLKNLETCKSEFALCKWRFQWRLHRSRVTKIATDQTEPVKKKGEKKKTKNYAATGPIEKHKVHGEKCKQLNKRTREQKHLKAYRSYAKYD